MICRMMRTALDVRVSDPDVLVSSPGATVRVLDTVIDDIQLLVNQDGLTFKEAVERVFAEAVAERMMRPLPGPSPRTLIVNERVPEPLSEGKVPPPLSHIPFWSTHLSAVEEEKDAASFLPPPIAGTK
jgi:hypothetical protein